MQRRQPDELGARSGASVTSVLAATSSSNASYTARSCTTKRAYSRTSSAPPSSASTNADRSAASCTSAVSSRRRADSDRSVSATGSGVVWVIGPRRWVGGRSGGPGGLRPPTGTGVWSVASQARAQGHPVRSRKALLLGGRRAYGAGHDVCRASDVDRVHPRAPPRRVRRVRRLRRGGQRSRVMRTSVASHFLR